MKNFYYLPYLKDDRARFPRVEKPAQMGAPPTSSKNMNRRKRRILASRFRKAGGSKP